VSIRLKVILPYLLLTLVVAVTGVYVVTRLVANSLSERLTNQLLEAGRVVSDGIARQEIKHLEVARIVAYTRGVAEAMDAGDKQGVTTLAMPIVAGLDAENLIIINSEGDELLHLIKSPDQTIKEINQQIGAANLPSVHAILDSNNPEGLPQRGIAINPVDNRYYYYSAIPVGLNNQLAGVIVVGTSLESILPLFKNTSLADIILYANNGEAIATTLGAGNTDPEFLSSLSIPTEDYQNIVNTSEIISGENTSVQGRSYSIARSSMRVSNDTLGAFAVALPLNFVLQSGSVSRNTYVFLYTIAMIGVVLIGYLISRLIINPLYSLVRTSQAIAGGDLTQRTNISSGDEIGTLATTFDEMTGHLQQRTVELERTYHILEQMDRTKTSFIEVSAHELRTPLTLIKGYTQMVQLKANGDAELQNLSNGILDGTERLSEIVNSMLDVSKIDNKTLQLVKEKVQVSLVIMKVQKIFKPALEERRLTLETKGLQDLPTITADPDLLVKLFYHLVMNAIKYTPDGGWITVKGSVIEEKPGVQEVEIIISDTGVGIDPAHQELVFEKFYQTGEVNFHSSGKTKFKGGGPGLGLAIARGIVQAHKGTIWVESPGHDEERCPGSRFYVRIPVNSELE
jgi:signal transduction histidine kinase